MLLVVSDDQVPHSYLDITCSGTATVPSEDLIRNDTRVYSTFEYAWLPASAAAVESALDMGMGGLYGHAAVALRSSVGTASTRLCVTDWTEPTQYLLVLGGRAAEVPAAGAEHHEGHVQMTWMRAFELDIDTMTWRSLSLTVADGGSDGPVGRMLHGVAVVRDPDTQCEAVLMAGGVQLWVAEEDTITAPRGGSITTAAHSIRSKFRVLDDVWRLDVAQGEWAHATVLGITGRGTHEATHLPPTMLAATTVALDTIMVLHGGLTDAVVSSRVGAEIKEADWNVSTAMHALRLQPRNSSDEVSVVLETLRYTGDDVRAPRPMAGHVGLSFGTRALFYGGSDSMGGRIAWMYDFITLEWRQMDLSQPPRPVAGTGFAATTVGSVVWIMGGLMTWDPSHPSAAHEVTSLATGLYSIRVSGTMGDDVQCQADEFAPCATMEVALAYYSRASVGAFASADTPTVSHLLVQQLSQSAGATPQINGSQRASYSQPQPTASTRVDFYLETDVKLSQPLTITRPVAIIGRHPTAPAWPIFTTPSSLAVTSHVLGSARHAWAAPLTEVKADSSTQTPFESLASELPRSSLGSGNRPRFDCSLVNGSCIRVVATDGTVVLSGVSIANAVNMGSTSSPSRLGAGIHVASRLLLHVRRSVGAERVFSSSA